MFVKLYMLFFAVLQMAFGNFASHCFGLFVLETRHSKASKLFLVGVLLHFFANVAGFCRRLLQFLLIFAINSVQQDPREW